MMLQPDSELLSLDFDLDVERNQFLIKTWRRRIRHDANDVWVDEGRRALWDAFGLDAYEIRDSWIAHTLEWTKQHIHHGTDGEKLEQHYKKYVRRFEKIAKAAEKRRDAAIRQLVKDMTPQQVVARVTKHVALSLKRQVAAARAAQAA